MLVDASDDVSQYVSAMSYCVALRVPFVAHLMSHMLYCSGGPRAKGPDESSMRASIPVPIRCTMARIVPHRHLGVVCSVTCVSYSVLCRSVVQNSKLPNI